MEELHPHINHLLFCIDLEIKEQENKYQLDQNNSLKVLKSEGLALHPIRVQRKIFGYADYPEISFRLPFPADTSNFKDGSSIECFCEGEESVKGILMHMDGAKGDFRLFAPDFPDWLEDEGVGIKLSPDHRTNEVMKNALKSVSESSANKFLFNKIHSQVQWDNKITSSSKEYLFTNEKLNDSQKMAVKSMVENENLSIIHGPPGTGKTTTLLEGILQLIAKGEKVLVSAPSNTAVDNLARGLIGFDVNILRVGNTTKVDETVFPYTTEGKMAESKQQKEIKKLKIRAEELRKMANQYKRNFGKSEREQRNLLLKEVKNIRKEIRDLRNYYEEQLFDQAKVILGTPIGLNDFISKGQQFDTLVLDEAGQCIETLAWVLFPHANKWVLAGDHLQLPPLVFSDEAARLGFNKSILEYCFINTTNVYFLNTQYRMRKSIADFSSNYFYNGELTTPDYLQDVAVHISFFDTAGAGFEEEKGGDGSSLMNQGELGIVQKIIDSEKLKLSTIAFISPYSGQVGMAKAAFSKEVVISTIDSFQGQEKEIVILSLVRSNDESKIGFLADYRRMNVALTRAKEQLFVIGDSSTIGNDPFYARFLEYIDKNNSYRSVWELE
jgi:ATP-dependent RNA/DNA helicase IGHMBP2